MSEERKFMSDQALSVVSRKISTGMTEAEEAAIHLLHSRAETSYRAILVEPSLSVKHFFNDVALQGTFDDREQR